MPSMCRRDGLDGSAIEALQMWLRGLRETTFVLHFGFATLFIRVCPVWLGFLVLCDHVRSCKFRIDNVACGWNEKGQRMKP